MLLLVTISGALPSLDFVLTASRDRLARPMTLMGIMVGMALATKWSAAIAWAMIGAWNRGGWWRAIAAANGLAVAATFAFFYPVYTAMPITVDALDLRLWLDSWR